MHCMDKKTQEHTDISIPKNIMFPSWLRDYNQVTCVKHHACYYHLALHAAVVDGVTMWALLQVYC